MNTLYSTFFYCCIFITYAYTMDHTELEKNEEQITILPKEIPADIVTHILHLQLLDIHNNVNTSEEARNYLVSVSLVSKYCNQLTNNPHITKNIVSNLSATLRNQGIFIWYEEDIAKKLNTPATKKYLEINNQIFSEHLTKSDVIKLLEQGADPNYRRNIIKENRHDPNKYDVSRHYTSAMPLSFFASGSTNNDLEIAQYLLEQGADVDRTTDTPALTIAIHFDLVNMVKLLLFYKPRFRGSFPGDNRDYLAQAIEKGNSEIINLVMNSPSSKPDLISALRCTINKGDMQQIQELFDHSAKPDSLLQEVTEATVRYPYLICGQGNWSLDTLRTTDVLQLFCNNGIENPGIIENALAYAKRAKQRAKEVITILEEAKK